MFTGIVQAIGRLEAAERQASGLRLRIGTGSWGHVPSLGDSIAVAGVCLTVAAIDGDVFGFDVVQETLDRTTLGRRDVGAAVNLEHALRADAMMDGHLVQGHVDGIGDVVDVTADPSDWRVLIEPPSDLRDLMVPKGSVTVEGVSLTITHVDDAGRFGIALVPTTLERTTLRDLRAGDRCNLESDIIARTVTHYLKQRGM
ncbi:MAG: riboflavin synthase [Planctomycetota bacterium]